MKAEGFTSKFFSEIVSIQGISESGDAIMLIKNAFLDTASRDVVAYVEDERHTIVLQLIVSLIDTPRKFHRFRYALERRLPMLLDEVDDYDLLLISALEACDAAMLRYMIQKGNFIFLSRPIDPSILKYVEDSKNQTEKQAFNLLITPHINPKNLGFEKYTRALAKEHWKAAFLGVGPFISIKHWVDILAGNNEDQIISSLKQLISAGAANGDQYEIITDVLREVFSKKYDPLQDFPAIYRILRELWQAKVGRHIAPVIAQIIHKRLDGSQSEDKFAALQNYLPLADIDEHLHARLFYYFVEEPSDNQTNNRFRDDEIKKLCMMLLQSFQEIRDKLELAEGSLHYLYRVKWAFKFLGKEDETIAAILKLLSVPSNFDSFVNTMLSLRTPWQPKFSDNHIDLMDKLIGLERFYTFVTTHDYSKLSLGTVNALNDFCEKLSKHPTSFRDAITEFD